MNRKEFEEQRRLELLMKDIDVEGFDVPEDLEKVAESYDFGRKNVARSAGYHPCDINIYTNLPHYMNLVLESLVRMPSAGEGSLMGKDELRRFLRESVEQKEISEDDANILTDKYLNYKRTPHRRSDILIGGRKQFVKLFLNERFLRLYKKFFGSY